MTAFMLWNQKEEDEGLEGRGKGEVEDNVR
jgi:hypothetical protein